MPDTITIGPDGLGRDARGIIVARFVDSFTTAELVHPGASVIVLRLYEAGPGSRAPDAPRPRADLLQVRLSPARARALARMLSGAADRIEARRPES